MKREWRTLHEFTCLSCIAYLMDSESSLEAEVSSDDSYEDD